MIQLFVENIIDLMEGRQRYESYLKDTGVYQLLHQAFEVTVREKPCHPIEFIAHYLLANSK